MLVYRLVLHYYYFNNNKNGNKSDDEQEEEAPNGGAIIITGCDTGFGNKLAFKLASQGFHVFAGVLNEASVGLFQEVKNIHPLILDVTQDSHVEEAYETVNEWLTAAPAAVHDGNNNNNKEERYLHAVINNAGIMKPGLVDWVNLKDYEVCMQVNCFGPIRMVKTFLPLLKSSSSSLSQQQQHHRRKSPRIVNMISVAGMVSGVGMAISPYEVSKHALEAFTDSLRLELQCFGISVVAVNPAFHSTPMVQNAAKTDDDDILWKIMSPEKQEEYGKDFVDQLTTHAQTMTRSSIWDMQVVVDHVAEDVIWSKKYPRPPPAQTVIGMDWRYGMVGLRMLPQWFRQQLITFISPNLIPASVAASRRRMKPTNEKHNPTTTTTTSALKDKKQE
eukprot:scaffold6238_cov106-Cylindrotheca_fusiformis.AAC.8